MHYWQLIYEYLVSLCDNDVSCCLPVGQKPAQSFLLDSIISSNAGAYGMDQILVLTLSGVNHFISRAI
jgi:hypothetical protein